MLPLKRPGCFWFLLIGPPVLIAMAVLVGRPQYGTGRTASDVPMGVPSGATDITYYLGNAYPIRCFSFQTNEEAFIDWAEPIGRTGGGGIGHTILEPIPLPTGKMRFEPIPPGNYLYYSWSQEDRGEHAAFDRDTGRGYYFAHTR